MVFNQSIIEEHKKRGIWMALGILYKPSDFQMWEMFVDFLLQMTYYNEDNSVYHTVMNCNCDVKLDGSFYEVDNVLGWIQLKSNPHFPVYINVINIVDYLAAADMSNGFPYLYSILPNEYKETVSKLKPETSIRCVYSVDCSCHSIQIHVEVEYRGGYV